MDIVALIETCGPLLGILLFILWKHVENGSLKPKMDKLEEVMEDLEKQMEQLETKMDLLLIIRKVSDESSDEPDDQVCDLPAEEAVRERPD